MLYQNDSWLAPDGAVNVCDTFESPLVGDVEPNITARPPECTGDDTIAVVPVPPRVQPVKSPVSNPPLTIAEPPPPEVVTVNVNAAEWLPDAAVPVTITAYVPAGVDADVPTVNVDDPPAVTD